jgi:hypothetical protein
MHFVSEMVLHTRHEIDLRGNYVRACRGGEIILHKRCVLWNADLILDGRGHGVEKVVGDIVLHHFVDGKDFEIDTDSVYRISTRGPFGRRRCA